MVDVYHGTNRPAPVLTENTNPKAMDELGTWFSTNPEYAGWFGKNHFKFEAPKGTFYEPDDHLFHRVFYDEEIFSDLYGEELASLLAAATEAPSTSKMDRHLMDRQKSKIRKLVKQAKIPGVKGRLMHEIFREVVYINTEYLTALRENWQLQYHGIYFKDSKIDGMDHDVWMVFDPSSLGMEPIEETKTSAVLIAALKRVVAMDAKDKIIKKANEVVEKNDFMNCRLFTQLVTDTPKLESQPRLKAPETGAILWWGSSDGYRHCAVALDADTAIQVPEWGAKVEVLPIAEVEKEYGPVTKIYKPKA